VTSRAYSAAACFLAFGNYAVALRHAQVLYHDVRFGGMADVTPKRARDAAKSLQDVNDRFALRLAERMIKRLIWIYIDLRKDFKKQQLTFPAIHKKYSTVVATFAPDADGTENVDLASFATALWARLSTANDALITNVMKRLEQWIKLTNIAKIAPTYRLKGSRIPGLLDGTLRLHKDVFKGSPTSFESCQEDLKLLLSLIVADLADSNADRLNFSAVLERASREFAILDSMNDQRHVQYASDLMLQNPHIFFNEHEADFKARTTEEKAEIINKAEPHARLLWHFCALLCRELFEGEHVLSPNDALLLGLVDEVSGGGPIQSKREFWVEQAKTSTETPE